MTEAHKSPTKSDFARTDEQARLKFEKHKSLDPFPDIPPALLNSADVADYVCATGMLWPFDLDNRKSASYEIPLHGKCLHWDDPGIKQVDQIIEPTNKFSQKATPSALVT